MVVGALAVLSLVSSLAGTTIDVPYVPQTDVLCGGAAAAMVLRYWGDAHVSAQEFEPLVDRRAGGIADTVLVADIARRGWSVDRFDGSLARIDQSLAAREPIVVLLADHHGRFHYVVVVGRNPGAVIVHDPSWGPSRAIREVDFVRLWRPSHFWSLVIRPGQRVPQASGLSSAASDQTELERAGNSCERLLHESVAGAGSQSLEQLEQTIENVHRACPNSAGPLAELAGIQFSQRRWRAAADLAREALQLDQDDAYARDVLGSSLFLLDDPVGALGAWNRLGKPRLDSIRIEGLHHTRYQTVVEALRLTPGALLTPSDFERARRRLGDLPDRVTARLDVRPDSDGFATVDVVIAERSSIPAGVSGWTGVGLGAAVDREVGATLPGFTGQGDVWTAGWRFWANRPRVELGFDAPRVAGLSGVWRVDASWDKQTYALATSPALLIESRAHAAVAVGDWLSPNWRYTVSAGVDVWNPGVRAASLGGTIERRFVHDHLSVLAEGQRWIPHGSTAGFNALALRSGWASTRVSSGWSYAAAAGFQRVSNDAPLGLWPGADDGHGRGELLGAHPVLDDGIISVSPHSAFGRTLTFANAEAQRWFDSAWPTRLGAAAFVDIARATRNLYGLDSPLQIDVGTGFRLRVPGARRVLRIDLAHGIRDGANALTIGWVF